MNPQEISILAGAALATSMLSAIVGMAGGIILLSVMLLFLDPLVAIPLHGVIQLISNGSRTVTVVKRNAPHKRNATNTTISASTSSDTTTETGASPSAAMNPVQYIAEKCIANIASP